jgi:hypothetical protein
MDTHDKENKAGPQKESSPVFRGGPISQDDTKAKDQAQNRQTSNPYRLVQSLSEDKNDTKDIKEQPVAVAEPVQKSSPLKKIKDKFFPKKPGVKNTKQKVMVILMPILFIIMIFMFRQVLSKSPKKTKGTTNDDATVVGAAGSSSEIDWEIPEPISMDVRDPIKPATQAQNQTVSPGAVLIDSNDLRTLSVRGILYSHDKPSAVIGNKIVHLNDKIDGATVVKIGMDSVVFEKNGKRWTKKVAELEKEQKEQEQEQLELNDQMIEIQS